VISSADFLDSVPFTKDLGIELIDARAGQSRVELDVKPRHLNRWMAVHGGVIMTLLDIAMASAGRSVDLTATGALTIEMKTSFMRPGPRDERLMATGICIHRSTGTAFCEAEMRDQHDKLIARSTGSFKLLRQQP
jgi:uncharacterized protein (TIGR00369 family)